MDHIDSFIDQYRSHLMQHIDALRVGAEPGAAPMVFVQQVLDAFEPLHEAVQEVPVTPAERAFWFALFQLEVLVEHPSPGFVDPYEQIMLNDLKGVRDVLECRGDLPERFFATRPGEPLVEGYDEEDEDDWLSVSSVP